jgi:hypothetical protein
MPKESSAMCLIYTGYVIKYAGCPITWSSKLQSTIALSTSEAEYIAMSSALKEIVYLIDIINKLQNQGVNLVKVFKDNMGAIQLAKQLKLRPKTKHLAIQYHHF